MGTILVFLVFYAALFGMAWLFKKNEGAAIVLVCVLSLLPGMCSSFS
jgi:flavin-dependent dehydrogenase